MKKLISSFILLTICVAGYYWFYKQPKIAAQAPVNSIPVVTATVDNVSIAESVSLVSKLEAERAVDIATQVMGVVDSITVKSNQTVAKGELLFSLEDSQAKAALMEATAYLADEKRKLTEYKKLIVRGAITQTEIDAQQASVDIAKARLAATQSELSYHYLRAPFDGTVGLVNFSRGKLVTQGSEMLSFDDLSLLRLDIEVPESHLSQLSVGMKISATSNAWPNHIFTGHLVAIDPRVNENTLNIRVRVNFENKDLKLRPGMMLNTEITFPEQIQAAIPVQALEYYGTKRFVYVVDEQNIAHRTQVTLGARMDNQVVITEGINVGDTIVVQGLVNIKDGANVTQLASPFSTDNKESR